MEQNTSTPTPVTNSTSASTPVESVPAKKNGKGLIIFVVIAVLVVCCVITVVLGALASMAINPIQQNIQENIEETIDENTDQEDGAKTSEECYTEADAQYQAELDDACLEIYGKKDCELTSDESADAYSNYVLSKLTCDFTYSGESAE